MPRSQNLILHSFLFNKMCPDLGIPFQNAAATWQICYSFCSLSALSSALIACLTFSPLSPISLSTALASEKPRSDSLTLLWICLIPTGKRPWLKKESPDIRLLLTTQGLSCSFWFGLCPEVRFGILSTAPFRNYNYFGYWIWINFKGLRLFQFGCMERSSSNWWSMQCCQTLNVEVLNQQPKYIFFYPSLKQMVETKFSYLGLSVSNTVSKAK